MGRTIDRIVEVSLDDFDDAAILEAAEELGGTTTRVSRIAHEAYAAIIKKNDVEYERACRELIGEIVGVIL